MSSLNQVTLIGHLGRAPELKTLEPSGAKVCTFSIATNEDYTDKAGKKVERVEWHRIVAWGKTAENCGKYLDKGKQVGIEGRLQTRSWEKDGETRYGTEVVARRVLFLGKGDGQSSAHRDEPPPPTDGDVPF